VQKTNQVTLESKNVEGTSTWKASDLSHRFSFSELAVVTVTDGNPIPASIVVSSTESGDLETGSSRAFTSVVKAQSGAVIPGAAVVWSIANNPNPAVASITSAGVVSCLRAGTVGVQAYVQSNPSVVNQVNITCVDIARTLFISMEGSEFFQAGQTRQFNAITRNSLGIPIATVPATFTIVSGPPHAPLSITAGGLATCHGSGSSRIKAVATANPALTAELDVFCEGGTITRMVLEPLDITVKAGEVQTFRAHFYDVNGRESGISASYKVVYSVGTSSIAENQNNDISTGRVLAKAQGVTDVTASLVPVAGGTPLFTATAILRVIDGGASTPATVTINPSLFSSGNSGGITLGHTAVVKNAAGQVLSGVTVQWSTSNSAVAIVGATNGSVTTIGPGGAFITASAVVGGQVLATGVSAVSVQRASIRAVVMQQAGPGSSPAVGATVRVFDGATEKVVASVTAGSLNAGEVYLPGLTAGTYRVAISLPGFVTRTFESVTVGASGTVDLNGGAPVVLQAATQ
jgi:hypothetical protein